MTSSPAELYPFLDRVPVEDLRKYAFKREVLRLAVKVKKAPRRTLYRALFALDGYEVLYDSRVRALLLQTLSTDKLRQVCEKFGRDSSGKSYDLVIRLRQIPWRAGDRFPRYFGRLFDIPSSYLPVNRRNEDACVNIEPYEQPPSLFDYQEEVKSKLISVLQSRNTAGGLIQLPTGSGKTRVAVEGLIEWRNWAVEESINSGVVWLAHSEELCEQAVESFRRIGQAVSLEEMRIARYWGSYEPDLERGAEGVIVAGYRKLANLLAADYELFRQVGESAGVALIDEAHKASSPTIRAMIDAVQECGSVKVIGLTATPGRDRESPLENRELADLFDRTLITSTVLGDEPIQELQRRNILASLDRSSEESGVSVEIGDDEDGALSDSVLRKLAKNEGRNDKILEIVEDQLKSRRPTIVFTCTAQHARLLAARLAVKGFRAGAIHCRMRRSLRKRVIRGFREGSVDALFNFGVLSAGFDAPNVETILIARPTGSLVLYSQMIGRGLRGRRVGGTESCKIIDVKDNLKKFGAADEVYSYFTEFWS